MRTARLPTLIVSLWWFLMVTGVTTLWAWQAEQPGQTERSTIEQALIERACSTTAAANQPGSAAYEQCLATQLASLRADFGRDLNRLSAPDRRKIDSECSRILAGQGREAYLDCLSAHLASVRNRLSRGRPAPSEVTAPPPPSVSATLPAPAPVALPALPHRALWQSPTLWIAAVLASCCVAAGVLVAARARRPRATRCRVCGAEVPERGDLCQKCRHEAAEAIRRSAAEREQQVLAGGQEERRRQEDQERKRAQKSREAEAEAEAEAEETRRTEQAQQEEARRLEEQALREQQALEQSRRESEVFDPHVALGVSRDASAEEIDAAYTKAKAKYDPDQAAGFGHELQDHYKAKAEAVERAYQMLRK